MSLLPLLLTSCSSAPVSMAINGDLIDLDAPTTGSFLSDYARHVDSEIVLAQMNNDEPFVLYVGSSSCSHCLEFKPNLLRYIYENKVLVEYLDVGAGEDYEEYAKIWKAYPDIFEASLQVPNLLIIENHTSYKKGASSKMTAATYTPFENMMNQLIKISNVTSVTTYQSAAYYLDEPSALYFFYDRSNDESRSIYIDQIWTRARNSQKNMYLVDIDLLSLSDKENLQATFELSDLVQPIAKYYEDGQFKEAHRFGIDDASDISFLDRYL